MRICKPHLSLNISKAHLSKQRQHQRGNMLKHALVPVLAAGALAAPPAYPTTTSASYPVATESSDFVRFYIGVTDDSAPEGSPFPYDTAEYINQTPSTGYFGYSLGEDWCSGQIVFTRSQVPEPSDYYFSSVGADNSTSIVRRQNPTASFVLHVASVDEADSQGRRSVNQTDCAGQSATEGLRVETEPFARLTYDDEEGVSRKSR
jgi:hypothetical protein